MGVRLAAVNYTPRLISLWLASFLLFPLKTLTLAVLSTQIPAKPLGLRDCDFSQTSTCLLHVQVDGDLGKEGEQGRSEMMEQLTSEQGKASAWTWPLPWTCSSGEHNTANI